MKNSLTLLFTFLVLSSLAQASYVKHNCEDVRTRKIGTLAVDFAAGLAQVDLSTVAGKKFSNPLKMYKRGQSYIFEFDADGPLSKGFDYFVLQPTGQNLLLTYTTRTAGAFTSSAVYRYILQCR